MFKRTKVSTGVLMALGGALLASAVPALAQTTERIEITGSLIRRIQGETALPVTTLKVDELQRSGVTNAEQIVQYITQQQGGTVTSGSVSGTNGAAAYVDLRSLGANRTLVLLNGKRVVPNPFSSAAVDLNTMPVAAIERVETLSDGASATYGTDAIAGVVNFISRKQYKGFKIGAQAQITEDGGGDVYTGDLLGGFGDIGTNGWNVFAGFNYREQKPLGGTEREFMRTSYIPERGFNGLSPTTFPANYSQGTLLTNPSLAQGCSGPTSISVPEANGTRIRCFADTQGFTNVVPVQEQWGAFARGSLALGANHTASVEYFRSYNEVESKIAPSPEGGLTMTPASPFFPGKGITPGNPALNPNSNISISWRTVPLGERAGKQENDTQRAVVSLEGSAANWDYSTALLWSNSKVENFFLNGYPQTQALRNGVQGINGVAPILNPFGAQTAAGQAYLEANQVLGKVQDGEGTLKSVTAQATRNFGKLPGGPIGLAIAAEYREEEMVYNTDIPKVSQAASSGLAGSGALREGDRDVKAVALELNLPVWKGLELGASVRYDKYSDFGNTTNPKFSVKYSPTDALLLRGSYNTGFSAPTLTALYAPNATTFTGTRYNDPLLCANGSVSGGVASRDCGQQFQRLTGGNTGLKAEESTAYTVGFVFQPTREVSFGLDFWDYKIKDSISTIGEQSVFADPAKYASLFVRCSQAPVERRNAIGNCQVAGPGDALAYIIDTNQNLGDVRTSGIDVQFDYKTGATPYGRFGVGARGSYVQKYEFQVEPGGVWYEPVGNYLPQFAGPVIRYQQVTTLSWENDRFSALLSHRYLSGYRDQNAQGAPFNVAPFNTNQVNNYSIFNLSGAYRGIKGVTLSAGVLNLFDTDPPFTNQVSRFQARGYDDRYANPLGRRYQVAASYEF